MRKWVKFRSHSISRHGCRLDFAEGFGLCIASITCSGTPAWPSRTISGAERLKLVFDDRIRLTIKGAAMFAFTMPITVLLVSTSPAAAFFLAGRGASGSAAVATGETGAGVLVQGR